MSPFLKVLAYIDTFPCIISALTVVVSSAFCEQAAVEHLFIGNECLKSHLTLPSTAFIGEH